MTESELRQIEDRSVPQSSALARDVYLLVKEVRKLRGVIERWPWEGICPLCDFEVEVEGHDQDCIYTDLG